MHRPPRNSFSPYICWLDTIPWHRAAQGRESAKQSYGPLVAITIKLVACLSVWEVSDSLAVIAVRKTNSKLQPSSLLHRLHWLAPMLATVRPGGTCTNPRGRLCRPTLCCERHYSSAKACASPLQCHPILWPNGCMRGESGNQPNQQFNQSRNATTSVCWSRWFTATLRATSSEIIPALRRPPSYQ